MRHVFETYLEFAEILEKNEDLESPYDYLLDMIELDRGIEQDQEYEKFDEFEIKITLEYLEGEIRFVFKKDAIYLKYLNAFNKAFLYKNKEKCKEVLNFIIKNYKGLKTVYHALINERMKFNHKVEIIAKGEN